MYRTEQAIVLVTVARVNRCEKYEKQHIDKDNRLCFDYRYCEQYRCTTTMA